MKFVDCSTFKWRDSNEIETANNKAGGSISSCRCKATICKYCVKNCPAIDFANVILFYFFVRSFNCSDVVKQLNEKYVSMCLEHENTC